MLELRGVCWMLWESTLELLGWPRDPSGALQGPFLEHFGSFRGVMLEYKFRVRWAPESSSILLLSKYVVTLFFFRLC